MVLCYSHSIINVYPSVPVILNGPMDVNLVYRDKLSAEFTCNAFSGDGAMLDFRWSVVNSGSSLAVLDPNSDMISQREYTSEDNSTTSEVIINNLTFEDRSKI